MKLLRRKLRIFENSLCSLVKCLEVWLDPTRVKHLLGALLKGILLAIPTDLRLGCRVLPGTYTSLLQKIANYGPKKFYNVGPERDTRLVTNITIFNLCFLVRTSNA
jgi:hypothetical protein